MKIMKWIALFVSCITVLLLSACNKDKYLVDGPGMEYQSPWTAFTISRIDSSTQYNFWFTVTDNWDETLVTGACSDEAGNSYTAETGIEISAEDLWQLRWMNLQLLEDATERPEDLEMPTDMATITLTLTYSDGTVVEKNASSSLSIQIYELLLPYLKNN